MQQGDVLYSGKAKTVTFLLDGAVFPGVGTRGRDLLIRATQGDAAQEGHKDHPEAEGVVGRIALTGAASFIGGRLLRRLAETRDPDDLVVVEE